MHHYSSCMMELHLIMLPEYEIYLTLGQVVGLVDQELSGQLVLVTWPLCMSLSAWGILNDEAYKRHCTQLSLCLRSSPSFVTPLKRITHLIRYSNTTKNFSQHYKHDHIRTLQALQHIKLLFWKIENKGIEIKIKNNVT